MKYGQIRNFIDGAFTPIESARILEIISPVDGALLAELPCSTPADLDAAVLAAKNAFPMWSKTPIKERVQVFYRYKSLLEKHLNELAALCSEENGKTFGESAAEIEKCIELTEFACSLPQLTSGEIMEVSKGVECRAEKVPLGVVTDKSDNKFVDCAITAGCIIVANDRHFRTLKSIGFPSVQVFTLDEFEKEFGDGFKS